MHEKITTIEGLAAMIQRTMASKEDVRQLEQKVDQGFKQVEERFNEVDERFDKIERLILEDHRKRIEVIETDLKRLKEALAI